MSEPHELAEKIGWKLVNDIDEMFARADIIWSDLDYFLAEQEKTWDDKEAAKALREFMGNLYEAQLQNMHAVTEALLQKDEAA